MAHDVVCSNHEGHQLIIYSTGTLWCN